MEGVNKKEMIVLLALTVLFGTGSFLLARGVDGTVATILDTEHKIDELTRLATDIKVHSEQVLVMTAFE